MMKNENIDQQHEVVKRIKDKFPKAVIEESQISEHGRKVIFKGLTDFVALKGEILRDDYLKDYLKRNSQTFNICDCIIVKFNDDVIVGIIEMKGGNPESRKIECQLGNGKILAYKVIGDVKAKITSSKNCIFLVLTKSGSYSGLKVSVKRRNKQKPEVKINGCPVLFRGPVVYFAEEIEKRR